MTDLNKKFRKEINAGVIALVMLSVLDQANEPMYGYQIAKMLSAKSDDEQAIKQGALYPVLRSLEKSGLLESRVEPSVSGPPRRYYSIAEAGRETLADWMQIWGKTKTFVENVLEGGTQ